VNSLATDAKITADANTQAIQDNTAAIRKLVTELRRQRCNN